MESLYCTPPNLTTMMCINHDLVQLYWRYLVDKPNSYHLKRSCPKFLNPKKTQKNHTHRYTHTNTTYILENALVQSQTYNSLKHIRILMLCMDCHLVLEHRCLYHYNFNVLGPNTPLHKLLHLHFE